VKIQYASDLHLEFPRNREFLKKHPLEAAGDILLLAGDIVPFGEIQKHQDFFKYLSDNFKATYWLPGNHEYYHYDAAERSGVLYESIMENVFLVNNMCEVVNDVQFVFSTLWSRIGPSNSWLIEKRMNDFHAIQYGGFRLSVEKYNEMHQAGFDFISTALEENKNERTVVCTHHVPTFLNYPERYKGDSLNEAFAVELFDFIETSGVSHWIYGHHHYNTPPFTIGKTTLLTNQLGYVQYNEHHLFERNKVFEV